VDPTIPVDLDLATDPAIDPGVAIIEDFRGDRSRRYLIVTASENWICASLANLYIASISFY